jgi:hypothetical protein
MASIGPHAAETTVAFDGLIGRRREVGELEAFLDEARRRARLVAIEGDAGIGKTRLWRHGLELARQQGAPSRWPNSRRISMPAARRSRAGRQTIYAGTVLEDAGLEWLLEIAVGAAGIERSTRSASGVEIVRRTNGQDRFQFILNYSASEFRAAIDAPGVDLLTGRQCDGSIAVPAGDVAIVRSSLAGS